MTANSKTKAPIVVVKRIKKGGHGHHGGAWKVAYADFVTAMMVFFLLLWLLSVVPKETLKGIGNYFTPTVFNEVTGEISKEMELAIKEKILAEGGVDNNDLSDIIEKRMTGFLKEKFGDSIRVIKTDDGIILRLVSLKQDKLFDDGASELLPATKEKLLYVLQLITGIPYYLSISGHVDKQEIVSTDMNIKWQVSSARSSAVRQFLFANGLIPESVSTLIARSDFESVEGSEVDYLLNRRIEIKLLTAGSGVGAKHEVPNL